MSNKWEGFAESWNDLTSRMNHHETLLDFLKTNSNNLNLEYTKRLLSVGPGTGDLDLGVLQLLPSLRHYTAIEPDTQLLESLQDKVRRTNIQANFINNTFEGIKDLEISYDLVLLAHVAYYFGDDFEDNILRALSWLAADGQILLVVCESKLKDITSAEFKSDWGDEPRIDAEITRERLEAMGLTFSEVPVPYSLDLSHPGERCYDFISVIINRRATRQEVDLAMKLLSAHTVPGSKHLEIVQHIFIIEKRRNQDNWNNF